MSTFMMVLISLVGILILTFPLVAMALAKASGWKALVISYRLKNSFKTLKGRKLNIYACNLGGYQYQNVLRMIATKKGLAIRMIWPFNLSHPAILIPWRHIQINQKSPTPQVYLGKPTITTMKLSHKNLSDLRRFVRG